MPMVRKGDIMKRKNTKLRQLSPRITEDAVQWYESMFSSSPHAGAKFVLEATPHLYAQTLAEMRGIFSKGELNMIIDAIKGRSRLEYREARVVGQRIVLFIVDTFRLYPGIYEDKWSIRDPKGFIMRLSTCTRWQLACLEMWANQYLIWWVDHREDDAMSLDDVRSRHCIPLL